MSVDFPAPFSPASAWTSDAFRSRSTRSSARTPGKLLLMPLIRSSRSVITPPQHPGIEGSVPPVPFPAASTQDSLEARPLRRLRDRCRVDVDDLLGRLLLVLHVVDQVLEGVAGLLAGELVDGGVQLPLLHVLESVRGGIEADGHLVLDARGRHRLDGADDHLIVGPEDSIELGVLLDQALHHVLSLGAAEVSRLADE